MGSFVKAAAVPIQECLFIASTFMEISDWCLGLHIYMLLRPWLNRGNLKTSCKFGISRKNWSFFKTVFTYWMVPYWYLFLSYQGKRISNWFRTVSLHILILEKQQSSKFQKIDQSYPVEAIKVTPKLRSKLLILKILVLFTHSPTRFSPQKRRQRNNSLFLFTIIIFNFIQIWDNFDRLIYPKYN